MTREMSPEMREMFEIAASATVVKVKPPNRSWNAVMTLAAQRGYGGFTLYQDHGGRWFRVNTEPLA